MSNAVLCDTTKCIGCRGCQVACKQWNQLPSISATNNGTLENPPQLNEYTFTKVRFTEAEDAGKLQLVFSKVQCMHCEHPACAAACPVGAFTKQDNGPVTYDDGKCIGCRYCMVACPFGVPTFQWDKAIPWIRKCTFCADRQGGGLQPACVTTCPTGALKFGQRQALVSEARQRITAQPALYVNHIYGEKEAGGTSWLYIASVPFEKLGFPNVRPEAVTLNAERAMGAVPTALLTVAVTMSGVYWLIKRRNNNGNHPEPVKEERKGGVRK